MPHVVELFYADHCVACPDSRAVLRQLASDRPDVIAIERNIEDDAEYRLATGYHLIATPAFVIDGHAVLYGVPKPDKLAARIAASSPETTEQRHTAPSVYSGRGRASQSLVPKQRGLVEAGRRNIRINDPARLRGVA